MDVSIEPIAAKLGLLTLSPRPFLEAQAAATGKRGEDPT
jgi:hypothetical protein